MPELDDRVRPSARPGIGQSHRLHRPEPERVVPAARQFFDREARFKVGHVIGDVRPVAVSPQERIDEAIVLFFVEGTIQVIPGPVERLAVTRGPERHGHVDRISLHDRGDTVVEIEMPGPGDARDVGRERVAGERPGGYNHDAAGGDGEEFLAEDCDAWVPGDGLRDARGELVAVDRQRVPPGHPRRGSHPQQKRVESAKLLLQEPGSGTLLFGLEGIAADKLGEPVRSVRGSVPQRAHLIKRHRNAGLGELIRRFAPGETSSNDVNRRTQGLPFHIVSATPGRRYNFGPMAGADIPRRDVFRAAGAVAMTALSYGRILGANDRIRLGLIGCGGRGRGVMGTFIKTGSVDLAAVCDVYGERIDRALQSAQGAKSFTDHRRLLEFKEIDATLIATPDHWHAAITIDALNAGKDVYVEKPLTLKIEEGPAIVKAARVNNRICQVGMQQRSGQHYIQAKEEYFRTGRLGKITLARTWWHGNGAHLMKSPTTDRPSNLDWARYLGPVRWREWDPPQYFNFRAYLDFGGGQVTDLFTHWIDVVHMFMDQDDPISAVASGGVYHYKDGRTAPDTINVLLEYPKEWTATFEATLAPGITGAGVEMCGTEGRLFITRSRFEFTPAEKGTPPVIVKSERDQTIDHVENFLECMRTRKLPNGDVYIGHRSAQASHLGNIAYVEKRRIKFDPQREEILPL